MENVWAGGILHAYRFAQIVDLVGDAAMFPTEFRRNIPGSGVKELDSATVFLLCTPFDFILLVSLK